MGGAVSMAGKLSEGGVRGRVSMGILLFEFCRMGTAIVGCASSIGFGNFYFGANTVFFLYYL